MADEMPFDGAGVTALGLAAARSVETGRDDRLIDDPYARALFEAASVDLPMRVDWPRGGEAVSDAEMLHLHGSRYIGLRTRVYDDRVIAAVRDGIRQVVLLGAGLDTRAYRLDLPHDTVIFELDRPALLAWKRAALGGIGAIGAARGCSLIDLGIDLSQPWEQSLHRAGFDAAKPCLILAEGLLAYLEPEGRTEFLQRATGVAAAGSRLSLDHLAGDPRADGSLAELSRRSGLPMDTLLATAGGERPAATLAAYGWDVREEGVEEIAVRYGRDLGDPFGRTAGSSPPWLGTSFVHAWR